MKKFKNIFIVAMLTLTMVLALAACGRVENPTVPSEGETIEESIEETSQENNEETPTVDEGVIVGENDETIVEVAEGEEPGDSTQPIPGTPTQPSNPSNRTNPTQPTTHVHDWVAITTVVHHDAITHEETIYKTVHHDAITHEEPIYEYVYDVICTECGRGLYTYYNEDWDAFVYHLRHECFASSSSAYVSVLVGYDTIVDEEAWDEQVPDGTRTVIDKAAWDETVVTGYRCSICGETK